MFDKYRFSNILNNIVVLLYHNNIAEFARKVPFDRTYASKCINKRLDSPPTPKILKKIADVSGGFTSYEELMEVCGYIESQSNETNIAQRVFYETINSLDKYNLSDEQLTRIYQILVNRNKSNIENQLSDFVSYEGFQFYDNKNLSAATLYNELVEINDEISEILERYKKVEYEYPIPIYDKLIIDDYTFINSSLSHISKYINLNIKLEKISDLTNYFGLIISDNSMAPLLDVGDIAIIYRNTLLKSNETYKSGETYLLNLVNESKLVIRKIVEIPEGVELHPLNMWNYPIQKIISSNKKLPYSTCIIGKVIKAENTSAFVWKL